MDLANPTRGTYPLPTDNLDYVTTAMRYGSRAVCNIYNPSVQPGCQPFVHRNYAGPEGVCLPAGRSLRNSSYYGKMGARRDRVEPGFRDRIGVARKQPEVWSARSSGGMFSSRSAMELTSQRRQPLAYQQGEDYFGTQKKRTLNSSRSWSEGSTRTGGSTARSEREAIISLESFNGLKPTLDTFSAEPYVTPLMYTTENMYYVTPRLDISHARAAGKSWFRKGT